VLVNLLLISRLPSSNKLTVQQRTDFEGFAKEVTRHLTDAGFMTYTTSMSKLAFTATKAELAPNVIKELTPDVLPPSIDAMKAIDKRLHESKSLSQLSIDEAPTVVCLWKSVAGLCAAQQVKCRDQMVFASSCLLVWLRKVRSRGRLSLPCAT
jgi:hypothetical protein